MASPVRAPRPAGPLPPLLAVATRERVPSEFEEQLRLVAWAAWAAGDVVRAAEASGRAALLDVFARDYGAAERGRFPALAGLAAVPNGTRASGAAAGKAKAEGVRAGYPDLLLDVARGGYHGWRGEMKVVTGGTVSAAQAWWHAHLRGAGYRVDVARGMEAMRAALLAYLALPETATEDGR